ncbi:hypothetical protein LAZ67_7001378 [Cordylochernes scorpioides]|uniref:Uncharacterized protein n=1 Tax=Cordylochernes scorpioides TaxID=51811 RepID=A0ABY6KMT8_9ARAC|nr:hypothetical protein LAZ67_7001378 [Cordylochernes scorpioides]
MDEILSLITFSRQFFLYKGVKPRLKLDLLFSKLFTEDDDFIQTLESRADEARKLTRIHTMRSQGSNELYYGAHHRNIMHHPGDLVWIYPCVCAQNLLIKISTGSRDRGRVESLGMSTQNRRDTVVVGKFREQIGVELRARWR